MMKVIILFPIEKGFFYIFQVVVQEQCYYQIYYEVLTQECKPCSCKGQRQVGKSFNEMVCLDFYGVAMTDPESDKNIVAQCVGYFK